MSLQSTRYLHLTLAKSNDWCWIIELVTIANTYIVEHHRAVDASSSHQLRDTAGMEGQVCSDVVNYAWSKDNKGECLQNKMLHVFYLVWLSSSHLPCCARRASVGWHWCEYRRHQPCLSLFCTIWSNRSILCLAAFFSCQQSAVIALCGSVAFACQVLAWRQHCFSSLASSL